MNFMSVMTFNKANSGYFIGFILIGAVLGQALGNLITAVLPSVEIISRILTEAVSADFGVIAFKVRLSISSIIGLIAGLFIFIKI